MVALISFSRIKLLLKNSRTLFISEILLQMFLSDCQLQKVTRLEQLKLARCVSVCSGSIKSQRNIKSVNRSCPKKRKVTPISRLVYTPAENRIIELDSLQEHVKKAKMYHHSLLVTWGPQGFHLKLTIYNSIFEKHRVAIISPEKFQKFFFKNHLQASGKKLESRNPSAKLWSLSDWSSEIEQQNLIIFTNSKKKTFFQIFSEKKTSWKKFVFATWN